MLPIGFLDNDQSRHGSTIAGLEVYGSLDALDDAIRRTGARMLLITMSNAPGTRGPRGDGGGAGGRPGGPPGSPVNELLDSSLNATRMPTDPRG